MGGLGPPHGDRGRAPQRRGRRAARAARSCTAATFTLGPIDLEIDYGERVAILGANGSGKTTLLDAALGRLPLDAGDAHLGPGVIVGELDQARAAFAGADALLARFEAASGLLPNEARSLLAKFGLGADHVDARRPTRSRPASAPARRSRCCRRAGVNCLVLDEPTNHLDLPAIEQLEQALDGFAGTLLLVTHDRALLDAVTLTRRIELVDGRIVDVPIERRWRRTRSRPRSRR